MTPERQEEQRTAEIVWGWDPTPGIVSVWAERDGHAMIWRRLSAQAPVTCERAVFRPWLLIHSLGDLAHLGSRLQPEHDGATGFTYRELHGPGRLRYLVSAPDGRSLESAVLQGASERQG